MKFAIIFLTGILLVVFPMAAYAGSLDSPAGPDNSGSAVHTLEDVYNRLNNGATGSKRSGVFTEPSSGPGSTGHTLDQVMSITPTIDDISGAAPGDVANGKTFWGLTGSAWGQQTGTMANNGAFSLSCGAGDQSVSAGYYNSGTLAGDTDLNAANIANGVEIFGVTGTAAVAAGNATKGDVLSGKTFSKSGTAGLIGTMANNGAFSLSCGAGEQSVSAGYYSSGTLAGDTDLNAANIANGVEIFGVTGTAAVAAGNAAKGDVLSGKTFSKSGTAGLIGTMANNGAFNLSCGPGDQSVSAGYYTSGTLAGDTDLVSTNIRSTVTIFGVTGDSNVVDTSSGNAVMEDIANGKKAWVDGIEITGTGTMATNFAPVEKTGQIASYRSGDDGTNQEGVTWPSPRFTNHGDGTVTDHLTGLMWIQNPDATKRTWYDAIDYCNGLTTATYTDWRLPNAKELYSLIDVSQITPALPIGHPFTGVQSNFYWSGSTYAYLVTHAWYVHLSYGGVTIFPKTDTLYVWPIRGGQ